ncbi:MAG: BamA/TamA family outer membrane protein [Bacteroidales bacterium]|jgi:outer membrane protein assembly factor BamA|nr:BamA/TamA family outer membrane protein [Bacteroidales bacterium]
MKKFFLFLCVSLVTMTLAAQDKPVKTGWKFGGALPAVSFDSDLGFQYGALFELFNYGDGSKYPDWYDHTYTEISRFTKGSGIYRFMFESNHLIPGVELVTDLSYLPDRANHFYGFNGYESVFNSGWMDDEADDYRTRMFYRHERNQFRFKNDFSGKLSGDHLRWSAGFAVQNFSVGSVDVERLNRGKDEAEMLPAISEEPGLFELYRDSLGLIDANEADGGWVNTVKAGLVWDSRDNRPNPMKGIWTELGIEAAPGFLGNDWGFSKLYITHRQYFTLVEKDLALVYRLGYQTTLTGTTPFFYQSQVITSRLTGASSEGLGGASSLRGVMKNRVVGDAFFYGNVEFRWKPLYFRFLKQDCYLGLNFFYDFGLITKDISLPDDINSRFSEEMSSYLLSDFFNPGSEKLHQSAGVSIMPVMNENFVVAVDIGKAFNAQDGNIGIAIGLNYLF